MSTSNTHIARIAKNKKKLFLGVFACVLLVTAIVSIAAAVSSTKHNDHHRAAAHAIVKSSCTITLYPGLCFSAISAVPEATTKISSTKDVVHLLLNQTVESVQQSYPKIKKILAALKNSTKREKLALQDCLEMEDQTLAELDRVKKDLDHYPSLNKSISQQADDIKTELSAAMAYQYTCLDGFSHDKTDKKLRQLFIADITHVTHMCSNALAVVKSITDTDMTTGMSNEQRHPLEWKIEEEEEEDNNSKTEWPAWLSVGDLRLLQATTVTPDVVVAADGSGKYLTVAEAVAAAPIRSSSRYIIRIKAGVYRENVEVPSSKTHIMFMGDGRTTTIITGNRSVQGGWTTFQTATVAAVGDGFLARDITFQNTAGTLGNQSVALRVGSDRSAFYRCGMLGYQDTLYVHSKRQFYVNCFIAGTIDFIFGYASAVLQDCDIRARSPDPKDKNYVTAHGRSDPNENTGIVIQKCSIDGTEEFVEVADDFPSYLGRPWGEYARTVIMQTEISSIIHPAGWHNWSGDFALSTLFYGEYQNSGPGANTTNRVNWPGFRVITNATEAQEFTAGNFISGDEWLDSTGFPFSLDL